MLSADEKPDIAYSDIGGLDTQKQEVREAVKLPLTHYELYKQIILSRNTDIRNSIIEKRI